MQKDQVNLRHYINLLINILFDFVQKFLNA